MPISFDFERDAVFDSGEKKHLFQEITNGFANRSRQVPCLIGRTPDGSGIWISFHGMPHPVSLILAPEVEWKKPGVIERMVRDALAQAEDPTLGERALLGNV